MEQLEVLSMVNKISYGRGSGLMVSVLDSFPLPTQETQEYKWVSVNCWGNLTNRPFPRFLVSLFQNESKCKTFHMKMNFCMQFHFHANQSHFALRHALKQRYWGTRKWPIRRSDLRWTCPDQSGEVEILLAASRYRNQDKLR